MAVVQLHKLHIIILVLLSLSLFNISLSQPQSPPPAPAPASDSCNGVFLSYAYNSGRVIPPTDPTNQAYRFESTLRVRNNGRHELKSWRAFVGFQHRELLVSASNAVLADGNSLPAELGSGAVFAGFPMSDLKSAVETAGDTTQMEVSVELVGTQFGVGAPDVPMPLNISLVNDGYTCVNATNQGNRVMQVCCIVQDINPNTGVNEEFLPRQEGDLTIMYDVIRVYDDNYWAQVSISNHDSLGRLDNWHLSFDWMREEFIYTMKGAYPYVVDTTDCVFGRQGQYYQGMDFSQVLNCQRSPTIIDLPPTMANDSNLGQIPFCCRNGTILSPLMDPSKSTSSFQMQVYKMPPDLNKTELAPPQNWKINGTMNLDYECGSPMRVSPSQFTDASGLPSETAAIASWQVVCNMTQSRKAVPRCCVSYSAFFNDSAIPCNTCACGCNLNPSQTCSATEPALLLRPDALLIPFENRTAEALNWADIKRQKVPNPLPCGDNCGVSINWHLLSDFKHGWSARITIFNWGESSFEDWFAAVQLDNAVPGFEEVYTFNGSVLQGSNNTIFMQGRPGLNYLLAETDGSNPRKDPRVPGSQQSVISFTKKSTPGIQVATRDGFPTKVLFNGEECALPIILPSKAPIVSAASSIVGFLTLGLLLLMQY
ncbi:ARABIDOPSIS THALIANA SEC61 BETA 1, SEC61 BETA 1, COBRA-like protein-7 precursor [Hibiscus trionum]|uniref:ARABIDOPSIS THALIANA SEC61 BETA 1, SEC61 BETA 1, COBRA-like protein-7 n=1 Tax=Hibiscus trionum TaxID=183268 RepID=A0A9W7GX19_HIBTR|nr:ARABIDOPSIS THALIANA SEC61 BETA 1, SEC61 BETA 1, COBRA-like protein-7 precursor [Hibiscus trionum]